MAKRSTKTTTRKTPSLAKASAILGKALAPTPKRTAAKRGSRKAAAPAEPSRDAKITTVVGARSGNGIVVEATGHPTIIIRDWQNNAKTVKLAKVGQPVGPLLDHLASIPKPGAKLASGVDSRNSPHSAKAVRDNAAANGKTPKAAKPGKAAPAKKRNGNGRGYDAAAKLTTLVKPKDSGLAEGSGRMAKLVFAAKCKTVGAFLGQSVTDANGKEHKCDAGALSGMLKRNHVRIG